MSRWGQSGRYRGQVRRWVTAPGSLSARLAAAGSSFSVQVLSQGRQNLYRDELRALGLGGVASAYVREVILRVDGEAVVFARSVTPQPQSLGPWRSLRGLGTRPLADVLFRRIGIARGPLQFRQITPVGSLRQHVGRAWQQATGAAPLLRALPARRSVFKRGGAPLLVMEVFAAQQQPWCWPTGRRA
jgi:chorismate--pyruvate lyase